uniref:Uncharacterized protein n=1 Tax=Pavo cristatus TaxID=9049 RepID=A0A8C9EQ79_PAVCR
MSSAPIRSPTLRPHRMKKDESFLGKLGGTLARKKKAKEGEFARAGERRTHQSPRPSRAARGGSGGAEPPLFSGRGRAPAASGGRGGGWGALVAAEWRRPRRGTPAPASVK